MRINGNFDIKTFQGPSERYYLAMDRFNMILEDKLQGPDVRYKKNDAIKDESPIFNVEKNSKLSEDGKEDEKSIPVSLQVARENKTSKSLSKSSPNIKAFYDRIANINVPSAPYGKADPNDIRKKSEISENEINDILKNSRLRGTGEHFKRAEDIYGVNAYVLLAMAKLESGWGESRIARDKNNLFGFRAYDRDPYNSSESYNTYADSIYDVARHLSESYLKPSGQYFNGFSLEDVNKKYCSDSSWAPKLRKIIKELI